MDCFLRQIVDCWVGLAFPLSPPLYGLEWQGFGRVKDVCSSGPGIHVTPHLRLAENLEESRNGDWSQRTSHASKGSVGQPAHSAAPTAVP